MKATTLYHSFNLINWPGHTHNTAFVQANLLLSLYSRRLRDIHLVVLKSRISLVFEDEKMKHEQNCPEEGGNSSSLDETFVVGRKKLVID